MICKNLLLTLFLYMLELICLHIVKWFQVLLFNINDSLPCYSFVCVKLNGFKYCYLIVVIQFNINHLFAHS